MQLIDSCANIAHLLLPQDCLLCGIRSVRQQPCPDCRQDLPFHHGDACPVCGIPSPQAEICGNCLKHPPHFDATCAAFIYAFPLDALLRALKYQGRLAIAELAGTLLAQRVASRPRPDLVIPMPLHPQRLRERGFNQASEIARVVARRIAVPLAMDAVLRIRATEPQAGLPLERRGKNIRKAFACTQDLTQKRIAIVDDVMTSGASLNELARTLKAAGAAHVECWVTARTLLD